MNRIRITLFDVIEYLQTKHTPILFVIVALGTLLRFFVLPSTVWNADPARDLLVSQHILQYHEIPIIGHFASGTNPPFYYPPVYYFLLTLFLIPSTNIWSVLCLFVLYNVTSIALYYHIAKRLSHTISALFATLLFTFSPVYVDKQTSLSSMHLALPIFLAGTLLHLIGIQERRRLYILSGLSLLVITASINYAALILIPIYIFWVFYAFRKDVRTPLICIGFVILLFTGIFFDFAKFIITTYDWNTLLTPFSPANNISFQNFPARLIEQYAVFTSTVFTQLTPLLMVLCVFSLIWILARRRENVQSIMYPVSFIATTLLLSAAKNTPMHSWYFYLVAPFTFIILGMLLQLKNTTVITRILSFSIVACATWASIGNIGSVFNRSYSYQMTEQIVDAVLHEVKSIEGDQLNPSSHAVAFTEYNTKYLEHNGLAYSYFLEKKVGKIFRVYDDYNNLKLIPNPKYVAIICPITNTHNAISLCKDYISSHHQDYVFIQEIQKQLQYPVLLYTRTNDSDIDQASM